MLDNKVVLITGASAGIGAACAEAFARSGANLVLLARREGRLSQLSAKLADLYGCTVHYCAVDVQNTSHVQKAVQDIPSTLAAIDILINNAGLVIGMNTAFDTPAEDVDVMVDTNIKGVLNLQREIIPGMISRGRGTIINISSVSGIQSYAGGSVYCATKHAVNGLTNSLRMDLVNTPLRVTTISPGLVDTEFSEVRFKGDKQKAAQVYSGMEPLHPEDVAEAAVFVASRPPHVQVADILIFPSSQASATLVARK